MLIYFNKHLWNGWISSMSQLCIVRDNKLIHTTMRKCNSLLVATWWNIHNWRDSPGNYCIVSNYIHTHTTKLYVHTTTALVSSQLCLHLTLTILDPSQLSFYTAMDTQSFSLTSETQPWWQVCPEKVVTLAINYKHSLSLPFLPTLAFNITQQLTKLPKICLASSHTDKLA